MAELQFFLNRLSKRYHRPEFLGSDPLEFAHQYSDPWDQEAVALLSALLAYGNVKQIRRSVTSVLEAMVELSPAGPASFVRGLRSGASESMHLEPARARFAPLVHRFNPGHDILLLLRLLARCWSEYGSLGAHLLSGLDPEDATVEGALDQLIGTWKDWARELEPELAGPRASFLHMLTAPRDGSCCKRWCMLLRWMGRDSDRLDLGLWGEASPLRSTFPEGRFLKPSQLVMPLDTHTGRISQYLELTRRKSLNWKAALEITERLKACDPKDPTRYDFSLARLGILDLCQKKYRSEICGKCELLTVCRFPRAHVNPPAKKKRP